MSGKRRGAYTLCSGYAWQHNVSLAHWFESNKERQCGLAVANASLCDTDRKAHEVLKDECLHLFWIYAATYMKNISGAGIGRQS